MTTSKHVLPLLLGLLLAACTQVVVDPPTPTSTSTAALPTSTPFLAPTEIPTLPPPAALTDTPTPGATLAPTAAITPIVTSFIYEADSLKQVNVGAVAHVVLVAEPALYSVVLDDIGGIVSSSQTPWPDHNVAEMQVCFSLGTPCTPADQWQPFVTSTEAGIFGQGAAVQEFDVQVNWVGPQAVWATLRFRDAAGNPILAMSSQEHTPQPLSQAKLEVVGVWAEATPITALPPPAQTAIAATQVAYPVHGTVVIEGGICCMGGQAGETLQADVSFSATSSAGGVTEMRVRTGSGCFTEAELATAAWEPFAPTKAYPVHVALNWIGFYVSVQYRDAASNLSPVFCDDISVEGMPSAGPTP